MIEPPRTDTTGRIHDDIPDDVPDNWDINNVDEALAEVRKSLQNRKDQIDQHDGPDCSHNNRYNEEQRWKEKLEKRREKLNRTAPEFPPQPKPNIDGAVVALIVLDIIEDYGWVVILF